MEHVSLFNISHIQGSWGQPSLHTFDNNLPTANTSKVISPTERVRWLMYSLFYILTLKCTGFPQWFERMRSFCSPPTRPTVHPQICQDWHANVRVSLKRTGFPEWFGCMRLIPRAATPTQPTVHP